MLAMGTQWMQGNPRDTPWDRRIFTWRKDPQGPATPFGMLFWASPDLTSPSASSSLGPWGGVLLIVFFFEIQIVMVSVEREDQPRTSRELILI